MDQKTEQIVSEWMARFDAAVEAEDLAEMERIVSAVEASPNRPFQRAMLARLDA